jgi:hypothetical protein
MAMTDEMTTDMTAERRNSEDMTEKTEDMTEKTEGMTEKREGMTITMIAGMIMIDGIDGDEREKSLGDGKIRVSRTGPTEAHEGAKSAIGDRREAMLDTREFD